MPRVVAGAIAIVMLAAAVGYYVLSRQGPVVAQPPAPPPADVGVVEMRGADIPLNLAYAGRVAGFRTVDVRSQVNGVILKRAFNEGAWVKQGDVLFLIDPRTYQATLDRANAQLAQAQATSLQASENFNRISELSQRQVATAKQLEDARAARDQAGAAVKSVQADIEMAKLNLEFTTIRAPVAGPTALLSPPEGSLVQAQQTVLTTITQLDPAYINFSTTDAEFRQFKALNETRDSAINDDDLTVTIQYGDGATYPFPGKINVSSNTVDQRTGTVQIRAIFPNPDQGLFPGQFVRVVVKGVTLQNAIVVPQPAVAQGPQGTFVYVVSASGTADVRAVKLDREIGKGWLVKEGLKDGDRVIVDGVMRVRPNAPVKASPMPAMGAEDAASRSAQPPAQDRK